MCAYKLYKGGIYVRSHDFGFPERLISIVLWFITNKYVYEL